MYIEPNEFEALLRAGARHPAPPALSLLVGALFFAVLTPVTLLWWLTIMIGAIGIAAVHAANGMMRLIRNAADHAGLLIID